MFQIGMKCEPDWACDLLTWVLAIMALLIAVFFVHIVIKENQKKKKRYRIKKSRR